MKLCHVFTVAIFFTAPICGQLFQPKQTINKKYFLVTMAAANWHKAFYLCRSLDMNLVSITSKEENDQIYKQIKDEGQERRFGIFWTSGTKLGDNVVYQWMSSGRPVKYTNWRAGEPNNGFRENQYESCIQVQDDRGRDLVWNDELCSVELHFICEQDLIQYEYCGN